ncbi:hypothetical protein JCM39068_40400 [Desulfocastanea catecholica]
MIMAPTIKKPRELIGVHPDDSSIIPLTIFIPVLKGDKLRSGPPRVIATEFNPLIKFIDHTS